MGCFMCDHCNRVRESREHGYHTARELGKDYENQYCEDCFPAFLEQVAAKERLYRHIDGQDMTNHFVTEDLEIVRIPDGWESADTD